MQVSGSIYGSNPAKADPSVSGSGVFLGEIFVTRVAAFIDGFNLYHAIARLHEPHLKWLDLWKLMERQIRPKSESLTAVYYFSAYAEWLPGPFARHQEYVRALKAVGVTPIMGHFKGKDRHCHKCGANWIAHEEKETDVNVALQMLNEAYKGAYDKALLVTRDSDLKPAIEMVRHNFAANNVTVVAPPHLGHSNDLIQVASAKQKIKKTQIAESLLPQYVMSGDPETVVATRPAEYDPPAPVAPKY